MSEESKGTTLLESSGKQEGVYFSPEEARNELLLRRKDPVFLKAVINVIGELPYGLLENKPFAVLSRHVATARMEDVLFAEEMNRVGLTPTWIEYTHDLFTSANPDKNILWKMFIFKGQSKKGNEISARFRVISDPCSWERKRICDLVTPWGESLVAFHHRLRFEVFQPHLAGNVIDASYWLKGHGGKASLYYRAYLSLFMAHGVLCEDFEEFPDQPESYSWFRETIFLPSLEWVVKEFGVRPIIIRLPWRKHLDWYHPNVEQVLLKNEMP